MIPDRVSLSERPEAVDNRKRFGDWEGDTLEGAKGSGGIASHVKRKNRYLVTAKRSDKTAETMTIVSVKGIQARSKGNAKKAYSR